MSQSAPTTIGTVDVFISHIFVTSISRSLYLDSFSTSLIGTFLSDGRLVSIIMHVFSFLSLIIMSGLLAFISLSVFTGMFHNIVAVSFQSLSRVCAHTTCLQLEGGIACIFSSGGTLLLCHVAVYIPFLRVLDGRPRYGQ